LKSSVLTLCLVLALPCFSGCATPANHETVSFQGLEPAPKLFSGVLNLPEASKEPVPVVILVHGSAGVDDRYAFHRPALLAAGIGTFEVDFKTDENQHPQTQAG